MAASKTVGRLLIGVRKIIIFIVLDSRRARRYIYKFILLKLYTTTAWKWSSNKIDLFFCSNIYIDYFEILYLNIYINIYSLPRSRKSKNIVKWFALSLLFFLFYFRHSVDATEIEIIFTSIPVVIVLYAVSS